MSYHRRRREHKARLNWQLKKLREHQRALQALVEWQTSFEPAAPISMFLQYDAIETAR